ncbi:NEDD4-like E3 ubiquitin-protein ligase WWP1 [Triplophysa rosa]|uniref:NEDD4-like E3 ubiquitin-protein ligase WWP1 n=1 Tax=Triplophysa rosa TaxID=992332 RepID=UPI002545DF38|nr:NEDD4-like E3 ubiquitin-protein ligase WWP1 [Triplophysa rosa]
MPHYPTPQRSESWLTVTAERPLRLTHICCPVVDGVCCVFEVMATGSSRTDCSNNVRELHAIVSGAKLKRKKNWFGTTVYVEVTSEGESKKTAKCHSSSHPKWDERLTLSVTPHSQLDFRVWSHHTLKTDALLGKASLDLIETLRKHDSKRITLLSPLDFSRFVLFKGTVQPRNLKFSLHRFALVWLYSEGNKYLIPC